MVQETKNEGLDVIEELETKAAPEALVYTGPVIIKHH